MQRRIPLYKHFQNTSAGYYITVPFTLEGQAVGMVVKSDANCAEVPELREARSHAWIPATSAPSSKWLPYVKAGGKVK